MSAREIYGYPGLMWVGPSVDPSRCRAAAHRGTRQCGNRATYAWLSSEGNAYRVCSQHMPSYPATAGPTPKGWTRAGYAVYTRQETSTVGVFTLCLAKKEDRLRFANAPEPRWDIRIHDWYTWSIEFRLHKCDFLFMETLPERLGGTSGGFDEGLRDIEAALQFFLELHQLLGAYGTAQKKEDDSMEIVDEQRRDQKVDLQTMDFLIEKDVSLNEWKGREP